MIISIFTSHLNYQQITIGGNISLNISVAENQIFATLPNFAYNQTYPFTIGYNTGGNKSWNLL